MIELYIITETLMFKGSPPTDRHMVAIIKMSTEIVSHIPASLSVLFSHILARTCNKTTAEVAGGRVNLYHRLEVPCKNHLYEPNAYLDCLM